jgi:hypothetical protein
MARIELLSDVHIGSGAKLTRDIDWIAPGDGYVYFADSDRLLEEVLQNLYEVTHDCWGLRGAIPPEEKYYLRLHRFLIKNRFGYLVKRILPRINK